MSDTQRIRYDDVRRRLTDALGDRFPELRSRSTEDFSVALLDTWAVLAEILGFASTRLHEESSIDLAVERASVTELARLLGYRPDPGVAAATPLAFTVDDAQGAWPVVQIPTGTAVASTPDPGQEPVTFETIEDVEGRPSWNAIRPRLSHPQIPPATPSTLLLAGTGTNVSPGDGILVPYPNGQARFGIVTSVHVRPDDLPTPSGPGRQGWTTVTCTLQSTSTSIGAGVLPPGLPGSRPASQPLKGLLDGGITSLDDAAVRAVAREGGWAEAELFAALRTARQTASGVLVFRGQAGILGSGAPEWNSLPKTVRDDLTGVSASAPPAKKAAKATTQPLALKPNNGGGGGGGGGGGTGKTTIVLSEVYRYAYVFKNQLVWADDTLEQYPGAQSAPAGQRRVFCDAVIRGVGPGAVVLRDGDTWDLLSASEVRITSKSVFMVSGRSTALTLGSSTLSAFGIRGTTVHLAPEWLPLAPEPEPPSLPGGSAGSTVAFDGWVEGLRSGQRVAFTGQLAGNPGIRISHVTKARKVTHQLSPTGGTEIELSDPLPADLVRESVTVNANVAAATHGQTRTEVLGSGDGQTPTPTFTLSAGPLTHVNTSDGSRPELEVYVGGLLRPQVPALLRPDEPGYVLREGDDGRATIQFGSPLPTGTINVRARYRIGLGSGARVRAGQLSMLTVRPAGVVGVTNPLPAEGGADPETADVARRNAPVSVRSLGRLVSLLDYEDFARAYPGIAKAQATWTSGAGRRGVLLTVAGQDGAAIEGVNPVRVGLMAGLTTQGDPDVPYAVRSYIPRTFRLHAGLRLAAGTIPADVVAAAQAAVVAHFSFDARDLGQPVTASEALLVLHQVPGVAAAYLIELRRIVGGSPEGTTPVVTFLRATTPAAGTRRTKPAGMVAAELLTLEATEPPRLEVVG